MEAFAPALAKRLKEQIEARQQAMAEQATKKIQPVLEKATALSAEADPAAAASLGQSAAGYSNSVVVADPTNDEFVIELTDPTPAKSNRVKIAQRESDGVWYVTHRWNGQEYASERGAR